MQYPDRCHTTKEATHGIFSGFLLFYERAFQTAFHGVDIAFGADGRLPSQLGITVVN